MKVKFHKNNIGRTVSLKSGTSSQISYVNASGEGFRIKGEENGPIVHDYEFGDLASTENLIISLDGGDSWNLMNLVASRPSASLELGEVKVAAGSIKPGKLVEVSEPVEPAITTPEVKLLPPGPEPVALLEAPKELAPDQNGF